MIYPFSVSMCVYGGDNAEWFDLSLDSVVRQTLPPNEIVLVVDGPIPDATQSVIEKYRKICQNGKTEFKTIYLEKNCGHGIARKTSISNCVYDVIALMDSDDICVPDRFEKELSFFEKTNADVIGGDIAEFIGEVDNIVAYRKVPRTDGEIREYIKKRCPFNQMTVIFKKEIYERAGGYLDWYCDEDYYLWLRMMCSGASFANTGTVLVNVRVGADMYQRRGGSKYFRSEAKLQKYMYDRQIIGFGRYLLNVSERFVIQMLLPNKVRGFVFRKLARS